MPTARFLLAGLVAAIFLSLPSTAGAVVQPKGDCKSDGLAKIQWQTAGSADGTVAVHYEDGDLSSKAHSLAAEVQTNIWPEFTRLTGRRPIADEGVACFGGGDGKLDVYLTSGRKAGGFEFGEKEYAVATPYGATSCIAKQPAFVVARGDTVDRFTLAHELWHAFQSAYSRAGDCGDYGYWEEAAATWAAEHVYPRDDVEHRYDFTLLAPGFPLSAAAYDAYTLFYAATRTSGDERVVVRYEEAGERVGPDEAVDAALPGGFRKFLPRFALHAWNQGPLRSTWVGKGFAEWDGLKTVPLDEEEKTKRGPLPEYEVRLRRPARLLTDTRILSRTYSPVHIADRKAKRITVKNPFAGTPHSALWAYVKIRGKWQVQNWTGRSEVVFCRQDPAQDVRELVVIHSNTSPKTRVPRRKVQVVAEPRCHDGYDVTVQGTFSQFRHTECEPYLGFGDSLLTSGNKTESTYFARYPHGKWDLDETSGEVDLAGVEHATRTDYATHTEDPPFNQTEVEDRDTQGGLSIQGRGKNAKAELHLPPGEPDQIRPIDAEALDRGRAVTVVFDFEKNEEQPSEGGPGTCGQKSGMKWKATVTFDPKGAAPPATNGPE